MTDVPGRALTSARALERPVMNIIAYSVAVALLAHTAGCSTSHQEVKNGGGHQPLTRGVADQPPDVTQAQAYFVYDSNIRLRQSEDGKLFFETALLKGVGDVVNVTIGATDVGSLTAERRAHTAMKAAMDIQRATGAEGVLLYLALGEDLPKISYSVATVAYAPAGMEWSKGAGVKVWEVEVSDVVVSPEAIRLAQQTKRSGSNVSLPIPIIYRKAYVPGGPTPAGREKSADARLFELLSGIIVTGETEHPHNVEAARKVIAQGANVNARDHGQTPLMRAAQNGHIRVMEVLLEHGADVNAQDDDGRTALMIAAGASDPVMVRLLLDRGAKLDIKDHDGFTAWTGSEIAGGDDDRDYLETRRLLRRAGAR